MLDALDVSGLSNEEAAEAISAEFDKMDIECEATPHPCLCCGIIGASDISRCGNERNDSTEAHTRHLARHAHGQGGG